MPHYYVLNGVEAQLYERHDQKRRPELDPPFPLRCPACNSHLVLSQAAFVDEQQTFALPPARANPKRAGQVYQFQEYRSQVCTKCYYRWHLEPTGRWSTRPDRYTGDPYHPQPCLVRDDATGLPIREIHDFRRATWIREGRFSDEPLAKNIVNSPVILFTGAGASVPFGFPAATNFKVQNEELSQLRGLLYGDIMRYGSITDFMDRAPGGLERFTLAERSSHDVEVLMDVLLRLQDLIVQEGGDEGFEAVRGDLGRSAASWFVFGDFLNKASYATPPLTTMLMSNESQSVTHSSSHFRTARRLLESTCRQLLSRCAVPSPTGLEAGKKSLLPLIVSLSRLVGGVVPIFTTNYDLTIEYLLGDSLVDGFDYNNMRTDLYYENQRTKFKFARTIFQPAVWLDAERYAMFHLHGAANYFIDPRTAECFSIDSNQKLIDSFHQLAWQSDLPCVLGAIAPATCKQRYVYAPYFGIPYDYLAQTLPNAMVCVVIGYSGRDETVKEVLARSLAMNDKLQFLIVGLGNPPLHLLDVIPQGRFAYYEFGFDERACAWIYQETSARLGAAKG